MAPLTPMKTAVMRIMYLAKREEEFLDAIENHKEFYLRATVDGYMPLVIETTPFGEVSVMHYYVQNGDVMRDPEIVYNAQNWRPVEITQNPVGITQRAKPGHYLVGANQLSTIWARNLKDQGFLSKRTAKYSRHPIRANK